MNGPTAALVIFFFLMCVKRLLLSLTPLLRCDTHTHTHTHTHTNKHKKLTQAQEKTDKNTHTDKGPETGGFSRVLGVEGNISIFMY